jgi:hypothetical protein
MHQVVAPANEKGRASRAPAKTIQHKRAYVSRRPMSRGCSRKILPTPDRRPAQAPARESRPAASSDAVSLGLLILLLTIPGNDLDPRQTRAGWDLAAKWAGRYIETKHVAEGT